MKNTLLISFAILSLFFQSCGSGGGETYVLNTTSGLDLIQERLIEEFGGDKEVYEINLLTTTKPLTSELENVIIGFVESGKAYSQLLMTGAYGKKLDATLVYSEDKAEKEAEFIAGKGKSKIKDIDFNVILENYKEAIKMVEATTDEFSNFHISSFYLIYNTENNSSVKFTLQGEKPDNSTSYYGDRVNNTNAFEFDFETDENGKLICTDGLEG